MKIEQFKKQFQATIDFYNICMIAEKEIIQDAFNINNIKYKDLKDDTEFLEEIKNYEYNKVVNYMMRKLENDDFNKEEDLVYKKYKNDDFFFDVIEKIEFNKAKNKIDIDFRNNSFNFYEKYKNLENNKYFIQFITMLKEKYKYLRLRRYRNFIKY